ncbi:MAG TPA: histidine kinase dimerization/phospho-acceptor domain-containing protein [candidate division Zixibacteria bacterium]
MADRETQSDHRGFAILRGMAIGAVRGEAPRDLVEHALNQSVERLGLVAGSVRVFAPQGDQDTLAIVGGEQNGRAAITRLEQTLLADLRRSYAVRSLYMTLDLNGPSGLFSYPLRFGDRVIGAVSGLARGERNLAVEEEFVSAVAAMIVLVGRTGSPWETGAAVDDAATRMAAVRETAAAINHEINNPLMAVVGNLELLLRRSDQLDDDTVKKLAKMQEAAERIRVVTQGLMRLREIRSVPYPGGGRMIDIEGSLREGE